MPSTPAAPPLPTPLVDAAWLQDHLDAVVVADVRWYIDGRSGRAAFESGHIPTAVFVDLDRDLSAPPGPGGRHPLPEPDDFAAAMRAAGIDDDTPVVAYDDASGGIAARLWWMLDSVGHPVAVLDGGIQAWPGELTTDDPPVASGTFTARDWPAARFVDAGEVAELQAGTPLIDARSASRYLGEPNDIDPRFGHIPGAANMPWTDNIGEAGFRPAGDLAESFDRVGASASSDPVFYCGSGVTACNDLLAWRASGRRGGRLYVGSWSEWGADHRRPIETGDQPAP